MPSRIVFNDTNNNEMECYLNEQGKLYINVGEIGADGTYSGFITLDKADVQTFIKVLNELEDEMNE